MEQPTQEKEWTKPELIVLVRSKPEEDVLAGCKSPGRPGPDTGITEGCWYQDYSKCYAQDIS